MEKAYPSLVGLFRYLSEVYPEESIMGSIYGREYQVGIIDADLSLAEEAHQVLQAIMPGKAADKAVDYGHDLCLQLGYKELSVSANRYKMRMPKGWNCRATITEITFEDPALQDLDFDDEEEGIVEGIPLPLILLEVRDLDLWILFQSETVHDSHGQELSIGTVLAGLLAWHCPFGESLDDLEEYLAGVADLSGL